MNTLKEQESGFYRSREKLAYCCAICSGPSRYLYSWQGFELTKCTLCRTEALQTLPTKKYLQQFYQNEFYQKNSQNLMERWEIRLGLIKRSFATYLNEFTQLSKRSIPNSFLDIGGGLGYYVRAAQDCGINATLMDYAGSALSFAQETLEVERVVQGDIQKCADYLEPRSFDFILARHTIEHLLDPSEFVANIARVMSSGGLLEIETPNVLSKEQLCHPMLISFNYKMIRKYNLDISPIEAAKHAIAKSMSGINPPKHLWGFTAKALKLLLEKNGFEVIRIKNAIAGDSVFDPLYYDLSRLSQRRGLGIPYYAWERATSVFLKGRGMNLAILARFSS